MHEGHSSAIIMLMERGILPFGEDYKTFLYYIYKLFPQKIQIDSRNRFQISSNSGSGSTHNPQRNTHTQQIKEVVDLSDRNISVFEISIVSNM